MSLNKKKVKQIEIEQTLTKQQVDLIEKLEGMKKDVGKKYIVIDENVNDNRNYGFNQALDEVVQLIENYYD